jgi:hypothetical protein
MANAAIQAFYIYFMYIWPQFWREYATQAKAWGKDYYDAHIPVVESRIKKAGIRLACLMNNIFTWPAVNR